MHSMLSHRVKTSASGGTAVSVCGVHGNCSIGYLRAGVCILVFKMLVQEPLRTRRSCTMPPPDILAPIRSRFMLHLQCNAANASLLLLLLNHVELIHHLAVFLIA